MTTLIRSWRNIPSWTLGGNDDESDCFEVMAANMQNLWNWLSGAEPYAPIERAECERFYTLMSGWMSERAGSDQGTDFDKGMAYWVANGWPADPLERPAGYRAIEPSEIAAAIARNDGVPCWALLPAMEDDEALFADAVLGMEPSDGHAMLAVEADDSGLTLVTWAETRRVSWAWWDRFGMGQFEVERAAV